MIAKLDNYQGITVLRGESIRALSVSLFNGTKNSLDFNPLTDILYWSAENLNYKL